MDGSTDADIVEKEAIFTITFNLSQPGTCLDVADLYGADANSILECIKSPVKSVYGDEFMPKPC